MTADRALDILAMSEQARWREGIEPEDERKAIETIREALQNKPSADVLDMIKADLETNKEKWWYGDCSRDCFVKLSYVLEVINKYRTESEGEK